MLTRWPWTCALALFVALSGCDDTGTPCRHDYQCYSDSCTWGSCDGPLAAAVGRALAGDDEEVDVVEVEVADASVGHSTWSELCPWGCQSKFDESSCRDEAGCEVEWECGYPRDCFSRECLVAVCPSTAKKQDCEAPCERRMRCTGTPACRRE